MSTLQGGFWSGPQEQLSIAWTLTLEHRIAECTVWSHPLGWELRVMVSRSLIQTQVSPSADLAMQAARTWQQIFQGAGWASHSG